MWSECPNEDSDEECGFWDTIWFRFLREPLYVDFPRRISYKAISYEVENHCMCVCVYVYIYEARIASFACVV